LIPKEAPKLTQDYPKGSFFRGIDDPKEYARQFGLTARAGIEGVTKALSYPVNAIGEAAGGVASLMGNQPLADKIKRTVGLSGGSQAASTIADSLGLPKPQNRTEQIVQAGAQGVAGGVVGNPTSASSALSAVLPSANSAKAFLLNAGVAAGLEASPEATLGTGAALAAATAGRKGVKAVGQAMDDSLQSRAYNKAFTKNPQATMDAEIIADLMKIRRENGGKITQDQINQVGETYLHNFTERMKRAGVYGEDAAQAARSRKAISVLDPDVLKRLQSSPEGQAILEVIGKANRVNQLFPPKAASGNGNGRNIINGVTDTAISAVTGIPLAPAMLTSAVVRNYVRKAQGDKLLNPRMEQAANDFRVANGPSEASKAMDYISSLSSTKATQAQQAAMADQKSQEALAALQLKGRKVSRTPGGGAYQALLEHTGLSTDDLNQALRVAEKIPEAREAVRAIRVGGGNTADGAIYPVTDIIKKVASDLKLPSASKGILSQQPPGQGILSTVSPAYQMATSVRQEVIDKAIAGAGELKAAGAARAAKEVGMKLKVTSSKAERERMVQELYGEYPEAQGLFDGVLSFKN
jgi:hypothetical protein